MSSEELELICLIRDFPLITVKQLVKLTGRPMQSIARSLLKLCQERKPYINRNDKRESINTPYVYALTRYASTDKEIGGFPIDLSERKDKGLRHDILINDIHIELKDQLLIWVQNRKTLWQYGVRPDAFFKLQVGERIRSFFLEAETGTNNHLDVVVKYKGYEKLRMFMREEPIDWLPMRKFSVLTVRPTPEAAKVLEQEVLQERIIDPAYKDFYVFAARPLRNYLIG